MRTDYSTRRASIFFALSPDFPQSQSFAEIVVALYASPMSCYEIAEFIKAKTGIIFTPRSVERVLKESGVTLRKIKEAFGIAVKKKRVVWAYRSPTHKKKQKRLQLPRRLRYEVLKRDGFKCVLCGQTAKDSLLEIDHIKAKIFGGTNNLSNLRTLCFDCNKGKQLLDKEFSYDHQPPFSMVSGSSS